MTATHFTDHASTGIPEIDALLEFLSRSLLTMSQANDEHEALANLAAIAASTGLIDRLQLLLLDDDDMDSMSLYELVRNYQVVITDDASDSMAITLPYESGGLTHVAMATNRTFSWSPQQPLTHPEVGSDGLRVVEQLLVDGYCTGGVVPLRSGRIEIGCLQVLSRHAESFDPNMLVAFTRLGEIVGMALEKVRLIEDLRRQLDEAERANEKLQASNRDLEEFAYVASHDLQEPLRKIRAFGDRLDSKAADRLTEQEADYLTRIQNSAGRMQTLINDLLHFSRVKTAVARTQDIDMNKTVADVLADLEVAIEEAGGTVTVGELPTVSSDPSQTRQLMQNLIGNAIKFRKPDGPCAVAVNGRTLEDGSVELTIADNGIGFDEKYLDKIFKPFQRLHGRNEFAGSGIGLAVCRRIAERQGGSLNATSEPGVGSTFCITFAPHSMAAGPSAEEGQK